jgi:hypothetical protein
MVRKVEPGIVVRCDTGDDSTTLGSSYAPHGVVDFLPQDLDAILVSDFLESLESWGAQPIIGNYFLWFHELVALVYLPRRRQVRRAASLWE